VNNRRKLLLALAALPAGLARAQAPAGKPVRVGIFERTSADKYQAREKLFVDTLRELGWVEGHNIFYDRVYADDDLQRLPALAAALVKRGPNLIFTLSGGSSDAVVAATRTIPIVLGSQSHIVERGWVKSLAHPGGNITGIVNIGPELGPKRLQLLKQALPKITRVGVLVNLVVGGGATELKSIEQAASGLRVTVVSALAKQASELEAAFASLAKNRIEALLIAHNEFFLSERRRILDFAAKQRVPVIAHRSEMTDDGALMSYSSILTEQIRRAAHLVDKILKGAKPGDIPIELPTKFELVVNQRTAKALGITIPGEVMLQANRVVE
jgi:putative ABC transport system substrate-binding protein